MWSSPDVIGLFSNNVVSFSRNVVLSGTLFSRNVVWKRAMLSVRAVYILSSYSYLFRTARRKTGQLTTNPLFQQDAHRIIRRRAKAAGIETRIGNHTFRATGITAYLKNSGKLEVAQQIANHESPRTTKLYDRRQDEISLDEIERIAI